MFLKKQRLIIMGYKKNFYTFCPPGNDKEEGDDLELLKFSFVSQSILVNHNQSTELSKYLKYY